MIPGWSNDDVEFQTIEEMNAENIQNLRVTCQLYARKFEQLEAHIGRLELIVRGQLDHPWWRFWR